MAEEETVRWPGVDTYIEFAQALKAKCSTMGHVQGIGKLDRKIGAELKFLNTLKKEHVLIQTCHLQSSNLCHFASVVHALGRVPGVTSVLQPFSTPTRPGGLVVDVLGGQGHMWVKVIARKAQALHLIWAAKPFAWSSAPHIKSAATRGFPVQPGFVSEGPLYCTLGEKGRAAFHFGLLPRSRTMYEYGQGQFGSKDLLNQAKEYVACAQANLHNFTPPMVYFAFYNQVTRPMAQALSRIGIHVLGTVVDVDGDVQGKLASVLLDDDDDDCDDEEEDDDDGCDGDSDESPNNHGDENLNADPAEELEDSYAYRQCPLYYPENDDMNQISSNQCDVNRESDGAKNPHLIGSSDIRLTQNISILHECDHKKNDTHVYETNIGLSDLDENLNDSIRTGNDSSLSGSNDNPSKTHKRFDSSYSHHLHRVSSNAINSTTTSTTCAIPSSLCTDKPHNHLGVLTSQDEIGSESQRNIEGRTCSDCELDPSPIRVSTERARLSPVETLPTGTSPPASCQSDKERLLESDRDDHLNLLFEHIVLSPPVYRVKELILVESFSDQLTAVSGDDGSASKESPCPAPFPRAPPPLTRVNLDISSLITLVSSVSHGHCNYVFSTDVLSVQAEEERRTPVLPALKNFLEGKQLLACQTAVSSFQSILSLLGGPSEKRRMAELMDRVQVVSDQPSARTMALKCQGKIKERSKIVFGTGDQLRAITVTCNSGFVRAAGNQGVVFSVFYHQARALTEQKEISATPL